MALQRISVTVEKTGAKMTWVCLYVADFPSASISRAPARQTLMNLADLLLQNRRRREVHEHIGADSIAVSVAMRRSREREMPMDGANAEDKVPGTCCVAGWLPGVPGQCD